MWLSDAGICRVSCIRRHMHNGIFLNLELIIGGFTARHDANHKSGSFDRQLDFIQQMLVIVHRRVHAS
jgi:hypothetical protein